MLRLSRSFKGGLEQASKLPVLSSSFAVLVLSVMTLSGCGKSSSTRAAIDIPSSLSIVQGSLPSGLSGAGGYSTSRVTTGDASELARSGRGGFEELASTVTCSSTDDGKPFTSVVQRLFCLGPTDFRGRLKFIDENYVTLAEQNPTCMESAPQEWKVLDNVELSTAPSPTPSSSSATAANFTAYVSCRWTRDSTTDSGNFYLGKKDSFYYFVDIQKNKGEGTVGPNGSGDGTTPTNSSLITLAKLATDGSTAEVFQISRETLHESHPQVATYGRKHVSVMHISADKTNSVFEVSVGSTAFADSVTNSSNTTLSPGANMNGVGCGVRIKTKSGLIYGSGLWSQKSTCSYTSQAGTSNVTTSTDLCMSGTALGTEATTCTSTSGLTTFSTVKNFAKENLVASSKIKSSIRTAIDAIFDLTSAPSITAESGQ